MIWGLFALFAGWGYCVQSELNKHFKIDGFQLNTFRSLFAAVMMIPLIPFMEWPSVPGYYLVIILEGAISVVGMMVQYNLAAKHNGRVSNLHQPIAIMLTFAFWLIWDASQRMFLVENPDKSLGILLCFAVFVGSLQFIRRGDSGLQILLSVIPVAVLYSLMSVVSKIAMEHGDTLFGMAMNFVFLSNIVMFLISIPVFISLRMKKDATEFSIDKKFIKASGSIAFFHTISWVLAAVAIILTPNPAYPGFITGLAPVWFMIYYWFRKQEDNASPWAGLALSVAALMLMFFTS